MITGARGNILMCLLALALAIGAVAPASGSSLYLFPDHQTERFEYWAINGATGEPTLGANYNFQHVSDPAGIDTWAEFDALGIPIKAFIFATGEFSSPHSIEVIDVLDSLTYATHIVTGTPELAGIVVDQHADIVYAVEREAAVLHGWDWDPVALSLTPRLGFPVTLTGTLAAYGLALDTVDGVLYAADGISGMVRGYETTTWTEVFSWAPSAGPVDVEVDPYRRVLYTTNPDGSCFYGLPGGPRYLCRYDLDTGVETFKDFGSSGTMGVATDLETGYIYVTHGCSGDYMSWWDTSTTPWTGLPGSPTGDIGDPAGIAVFDYEPHVPIDLIMGASTNIDVCAPPGSLIEIAYQWKNRTESTTADSVWLIARIDSLLTYVDADPPPTSAPARGMYDVTWYLGSLAPGDSGLAIVTVEAPLGEAYCGTVLTARGELVYVGGMDEDSVRLPICPCDTLAACPRSAGFWKQQCRDIDCSHGEAGPVKFDCTDMELITACIDARSLHFAWDDDFASFCATVDPAVPMDARKQAKRQFVALLANVCVGQLGLVAGNGDIVSLPESTPILSGCDGMGSTVGAAIDYVDARLNELESEPLDQVLEEYEDLVCCLDLLNNAVNIEFDPYACVAEGNSVEDAFADGGLLDFYHTGVGEEHDVAEVSVSTAPNPFSGATTMSYAVGGALGEQVELAVYDISGRKVRTLQSGFQRPGSYELTWDGRNDRGQQVASGVYFYSFQAGGEASTKKLLLVR